MKKSHGQVFATREFTSTLCLGKPDSRTRTSLPKLKLYKIYYMHVIYKLI